jgi:MFS family permease
MRAAIGTLILATSLVQLANGFFGTLVSLRVAIEDFGSTLAGIVLSSYFAGFTLAAVRCGRIIERVGHIRAYAAFAGLVAAATAAMPLWDDPIAWLVLRAVVGFGCAGLFITTESWLNAKAPADQRGRVFAIYMVGTFAALAAGQLLIAKADVGSAEPFNTIVALFALALVMVSTTRAEAPKIAAGATLPMRQLVRAAPIAVAGCLLSGMMSGTFYSLLPAWAQGEGIDRRTIALFMFAAVAGGLAFQVPVGWWSDGADRRRVLATLALGFAVAAVALAVLPHTKPMVLTLAPFLGGFLSTLYPVCVARAHDCMPADRVVAVSGRLILVSGVGSVIGPLLGTWIMAGFGINGVLYFLAVTAAVLTMLAWSRSTRVAAPPHEARPFDIVTPQASPLAHALREPIEPSLGTAAP